MYARMDGYRIETELGKGTFGTVFLVTRKRDYKPFVIKQQNLNSTMMLSFKMILGEIQCLRQMRHPNIVAYYGAWIERNHSYILMEYATRGTLRQLLDQRSAPLNEHDTLYLFSQVILGVHHIHAKKILHRDLKSENIMLTGRRGDVVKIGDFGVSKSFDKESITCRAGSYHYMAPEMLTGKNYDFKCDIWSMGVVLYEMITKELPFPATSLTEIRMMVNQEPKPLSVNVSQNVVNLISKMLRKQPAFRPKASQLVLCPFLAPFIVRVHLNIGRTSNIAGQQPENFGTHVFAHFFNPQRTCQSTN